MSVCLTSRILCDLLPPPPPFPRPWLGCVCVCVIALFHLLHRLRGAQPSFVTVTTETSISGWGQKGLILSSASSRTLEH